MKLGLSAKGDPRGRHLVLVCGEKEGKEIYPVLLSEVLGEANPVVEFDHPRKRFFYRFHLRFLERLQLAFPFVELSPALDSWQVAQQRKAMKALPVPDIEIPGFYDYKLEQPAAPYDFQKTGIDEIERYLDEHLEELLQEANQFSEEMQTAEGAVYFLNDELGLGKTVQAVGVATRKRWFPALGVAPYGGKWSTKRIIDRYFDDDFTVQVVEGTRQDRALQILSGADLLLVNFETIRAKRWYNRSTREWTFQFDNPELFFECSEPLDNQVDWIAEGRPRRKFEFVVIDEHHRAKNKDAQVTNGVMALQADRFLMMSGTPIMNRVEEIWTMLHKADPHMWPTYYAFEQEVLIKTSAGKIIGYKPDGILKIRNFLAKRSLRRRKDHVSDDLPKVVYVQRDVELTPEQRRLYKKIQEELKLELEDGSNKHIMNALSRMTRLKQACFSPELYGGSKNSAKINEIKSDVAQLVASGEKAIVFSQWSRATRILERELAQYNPAYVDGSVKGKKRQAQEDKFNFDDDCHLYIGTIGANREAITLSAATYVLFADKEWSPLANQQAAGRSAAGGLRGAHLTKDHKVHIIEYLAIDTIEQYIEQLLATKKAVFDMMVEKDGGVRYPKMTMRDIKGLLAA